MTSCQGRGEGGRGQHNQGRGGEGEAMLTSIRAQGAGEGYGPRTDPQFQYSPPLPSPDALERVSPVTSPLPWCLAGLLGVQVSPWHWESLSSSVRLPLAFFPSSLGPLLPSEAVSSSSDR